MGSERELRTCAAAVRRAVARGELPSGCALSCHVKLDTGMHRLGFPAVRAAEARRTVYALRSLAPLPGVRITGIYTHPASADDPCARETEEQLRAFCRVRRLLGDGYAYHFSNSAAALSLGALGFDHYRPGIALYGLPPGKSFPAALAPRMRAVARMETCLTRVFTLRTGERLGYGGSFCAPRNTRVGVAAVGYADGLPRAATGGALLVRGKACPIIGHVCMDQCMIDVGDLPVSPGERVVVTEESGSNLLSLSQRAHTIPYELLCHLSRRAEKIYING
jgi:alanine racemase